MPDQPASTYAAPFTLRRLYHEQRYTFQTLADARAFAIAANAGPESPEEPWGLCDANNTTIPWEDWR